jgi:general nucleoside transport system ATP-binding protein
VTTAPPVLELRGVRRRFGTVQALAGVDLAVRSGEIHALIGENGAGKSTLVNVVAGLVVPDDGDLHLDGHPLAVMQGRRSAAAAGIGVVHQHFSLVETLTVAENVQLGRPGSGRLLATDRAGVELRYWSERLGLSVHPDALVEDLSVGERQRVEILTALVWGARLLLLDEPTAVLSPLEADAVLGVVRQLADDGLAVVFVTHKLREVELVADRVTVLRAGQVVGRHEGRGVSRDVLAHEMIGAGREVVPVGVEGPIGAPRLEVHGLRTGRLQGVELTVRAGEVVGVAGVAGNGQDELVRAIAGLVTPDGGEVVLDGRPVREGDPAVSRLLGFVPEDRAADGLALELPVWLNAVAKRTGEVGGWRGVDRRRVGAIARRVIERLGVVPASPALPAGSLSGGNQQRLVVGRELDGTPPIVVASEPTRGLDPGSTLDVIEALAAAAGGGAAVLVVSSELDELLLVAQRIVVLYEGALVLDVARADATRALVGRAMVGA